MSIQMGFDARSFYTFNFRENQLNAYLKLDGFVRQVQGLELKRHISLRASEQRSLRYFHECPDPDPEGSLACRVFEELQQ